MPYKTLFSLKTFYHRLTIGVRTSWHNRPLWLGGKSASDLQPYTSLPPSVSIAAVEDTAPAQSYEYPHELAPPEAEIGDHALVVVRALIGAVPGFGSPLVELMNAIGTPLQRRQLLWAKDVAFRLALMERRSSLRISELTNNEAFLSAISQAADAAKRTHYEEKLEALRNAVLNSACASDQNHEQSFFIQLVVEFTPIHLHILRLFANLFGWFGPDSVLLLTPIRSTYELLYAAFPELSSQTTLVERVLDDLMNRGLIVDKNMKVGRTSNAWRKRSTDLGDSFLVYISIPPSAV